MGEQQQEQAGGPVGGLDALVADEEADGRSVGPC
ncbi:hypothetical protein QFZ58_006564 [Streptomyces sp. B1I3]|nr:hypothetical protein [Streptomyces sp. B1I3]